MENNEIIVVRQLPIIEEQLRTVQQAILERVDAVLSMDCTEETYREVKKARADLNKKYKELEARRREVKAKIEAPYKAFEAVYKTCAGDIFTAADKQLADKIRSVEDGLRREKGKTVTAYFNEYRQSLGLPEDLADIRFAGINVTLSASERSLRNQAKAFLDRLNDDLTLIDTYENRDEILAEYRSCRNAAQAVKCVFDRHKQIEAERIRRDAARESVRKLDEHAEEVMAVIEQEEQLTMPETVEAPADEFHEPVAGAIPEENAPEAPIAEPEMPNYPLIYAVAFRLEGKASQIKDFMDLIVNQDLDSTVNASISVSGTLDQLKSMKKFLNDGGYTYEQL